MESSNPTRIPAWPLPLFVLLSALVYWPVLGLSPFSDDHSALWNSGVNGIPWRNGFFRPLSDLTFRMGHMVFGTSVVGHRLFNVVLHGVNAFLLFTVFLQLGRDHDRPMMKLGAWISALLFLVYPFHQESIIWLVGRESALGSAFILIGLYMLASPRASWLRISGASLALVFGALCYESSFLLPLLAVYILIHGGFSKPVPVKALMVGFGMALLLYVLLLWREGLLVQNSYFGVMFAQGIGGWFANVPRVLFRLFLPPVEDMAQIKTLGVVLAALLIVIAVVVRRSMNEGSRLLLRLYSGLLLIACILPIIGAVSVRTSESDRFLYLPSIFLCALLGTLIAAIPLRVVRFFVLAVLLVCSVHFLRLNHANWILASKTTQEILKGLPDPPERGRLFLNDLPDSYAGAFIFRNGMLEAIALSGKQTNGYVVVADPDQDEHVGFPFRGKLIIPNSRDRWVRWDGHGFVDR